MTIFSSLAKSIGGSSTSISKAIPISSLPKPSSVVPPVRASVPNPELNVPIKSIDETPIPDAPSTKPSVGSKVGTAVIGVGGLGLAGAGIIPMLLNSSAVTGAISGASNIGIASVLGDDIAGVANNLVDDITSSPLNMALTVGAIGAVVYLLYR